MRHSLKFPKYLILSNRLFLFLVAIFIDNLSFGQNATTLYFDIEGKSVNKTESFYQITGTIPPGKSHFVGKVIEKYTSNNAIKAKKTYNESGQQTGVGVEYYKNGQEKEKYQLKNGHIYGGYVFWFPNGINGLEREYIDYSTATEINHKTYNAWDSLGNQTVKDGMGNLEEYHSDLTLAATGKIYKGMRTGTWQGYYSNGNKFYTEKYKGGELISGESIRLDSSKFSYTHINILPSPKIGFIKYYEKLTKDLRYPKEAKKIGLQGTVHIAYTIGKNGQVISRHIIKNLSRECDIEALRLFDENPVEWNPGTSRGNPKAFILSLPVSFKL